MTRVESKKYYYLLFSQSLILCFKKRDNDAKDDFVGPFTSEINRHVAWIYSIIIRFNTMLLLKKSLIQIGVEIEWEGFAKALRKYTGPTRGICNFVIEDLEKNLRVVNLGVWEKIIRKAGTGFGINEKSINKKYFDSRKHSRREFFSWVDD